MAIKLWKKSVDFDPEDLNALQDLEKAHSTLRFSSKAIYYQGEVRRLQMDQEGSKRYARYKVGQAYAQFCDIYATSWEGVEDNKKQVESFKSALDLVDETILDDKEYRDWLLHTAKAYEKLCQVYLRNYEYEKYKESVKQTVELLDKALCKCTEDNKYQAEIWTTMGNTFARNQAESLSLQDSVPQKYREKCRNPAQCYKKALELDQDNPWILGKQGVHYYRLKKYDQALTSFSESPDYSQNEPSFNDYKARTHIKKATLEKSAIEKKKLLQDAKKYALLDLDKNFYPRQVLLAGEVHYHLYMASSSDSPERAEYLLEALRHFSEASAMEVGRDISEVYLKWARCLKDCGDTRAAIESYKVAFEVEKRIMVQSKFLPLIAKELLNLMKDNLDQMEKDHKSLLGCREMGFWLLYTSPPFQSEGPHKMYSKHHLETRKKLMAECLEKMASLTMKGSSESLLHKKCMAKFCERSNQLQPKDDTLLTDVQNFRQTIEEHLGASFHNPPEHCLTQGQNIEYDFYIINDEDNYEVDNWVQHSLLTNLENPVFGLKGYYHPRDSKLGQLDIKARTEAIPKCAHHILVISNNFDAKTELLTEVAQGLEGIDVIVLIREPNAEVPPQLKVCHTVDMTLYAYLPALARRLTPVPL